MTESIYTVKGMTCGHCVASVSEEVSRISGVTEVAVDLSTGAVKVTSHSPVNTDEIRVAIEDAGYVLVA